MTHTATFRCHWEHGVEELCVELSAPVRLTRLQHKLAAGGLNEFKPNHDFTVWTNDQRASWARYRLQPEYQGGAALRCAMAAAVLQFLAITGMKPCKRGLTEGLYRDVHRSGLPVYLDGAYRHPVTKKYFLVGRPFSGDVPRLLGYGFDIEQCGNQCLISRKQKPVRNPHP